MPKREPKRRPRPLERAATAALGTVRIPADRCVAAIPATNAFRGGANVKSAAVWRGVR